MPRRAVAAVLFLSLTAGCGGGGDSRTPGAGTKAHRPNPVVLGAGKLVDIGGGRSLYLACAGSGSPTVVLSAGWGGSTDNWSAVRPVLGRRTRVCAYDRAGSGYSPANAAARDARDEVDDLQRLLVRAHLTAPYVLVGHSYGGLIVRLFAHAHPSETAGVVLVDAMGRSQDRRLWRIWRAQPRRVRRAVTNPLEASAEVLPSEALADRVTTLGDTPVVVVSRGRPDTGEEPLPPRLSALVEQLWRRMQDELASLSSHHAHAVAARSGHFVQTAQPSVVIHAVDAVLAAARRHAPLASCSRIFPRSGVHCRS